MGFKIVRDRQREFCETHGVSGTWRTSPNPKRALGRKLLEEVGEYLESEDPQELYDILDVLAELIGLTDPYGEASNAAMVKRQNLGIFANHLEWSPVPNDR